MSDEKQPETDAEYLTRHGWTRASDESDGDWWVDPQMHSTDSHGTSQVRQDSALTIQSARDEQEERAAWVQFAAHISGAVGDSPNLAARGADKMLVEYRARFARKVAP